jgi:superfamily II DNA or RNA helicase
MLQTRYDIDIKPEAWVMSNRAKYVNWVDRLFKYGKPPKQKCLTCTDESCPLEKVSMFPHQKFVKDYLQFSSPYRGLLLYFGLGSGKTLASIAAAEILMNHMDVMVLLPTSLEQNYISEIRKYGRKYYALHQYWVKKPDPDEKTLKELKISSKIIKKHKGLWLPILNKQSNFSSLPNDHQKQIIEQTENVIQNRYNFIHIDGLRVDFLKEFAKDKNPFDNKCIIIDEVHNLISRIRNESKTGKPLYNLLISAENCKIILLSGTPVINRPSEFAFLINILSGYQKVYESIIKKGNFDQLEEFLAKYKYIDYFNIDKQKKKIIFTLLPTNFRWHNRKELEVKRTDPINILEDLRSKLADINITIDQSIIHSAKKKATKEFDKYFRVFPETDEEFNNIFIDLDKQEFKNPNLFMRRILGKVAYYNNYSEDLFPSVTIKDVPIPMPPYMFVKYQECRTKERSKERQTTLFSESGQVYRFYSRAISNFAFPEEFKRYFPSDMRKLVKEMDDVDGTLNKATESKDPLAKDEKYEVALNKELTKLKESDYLLLDKIYEYSPKFFKILEAINKLEGTALVYSQFRAVEGLGLFCATMDKNDYCEFKIKKNDNQEWDLDMSPSELAKPKYFQFYGNDEKTQVLLKIFNSDIENIPPLIRKKLDKTDNFSGNWIKVILITQSGSEGISLKNVRQVHIIEPFWNHIRLDQVIGRAVRTCSHVSLPKEQRHVDVYIYYMIFTKQQLKDHFTLDAKDKSMTSDEYLYDIAKKKKKIIDDMLLLVKQASVDCALNSKYHTKDKFKCFSLPANTPPDNIIYTYSLNNDVFDTEYAQQLGEQSWTGIVYITKKGQFLINKATKDVYDYDLYLSSNKLVKLGQLISSDNKQIIKMTSTNTNITTPEPIVKKKLPSITKLKMKTPKHESPKSNSTKSESPKSDSTKSESSKSESTKSESPKSESPPISIKLGLLQNKDNSCYLDSLLMSIMHCKNDILTNILESGLPYDGRLKMAKIAKQIKQELQNLYNHIQSGKNMIICSKIRELFKSFDESYKEKNKSHEMINWDSEQQEPLDVILLFSRMFKLSENIKKRIIATDGDVIFDTSAITVLIDIENDNIVDLHDYIPKHIEHIKKKTKTTIYESCKGMFVHVKRGYVSDDHEHKRTNKIKYYETLQTENGNKLELISIIVHHGSNVHGGHYTCLIKHENKWYGFDDLKDKVKYIGDFKNISDHVSENAVDFIYI